jgi:CrcB protein
VAMYLAVGCGAAIGALARYVVTLLFGGGSVFGVVGGTLAVNIVGSFLIGLFATLSGPDGRLLVSPTVRQFVMSGICGGFTTFSLASLDTFLLIVAGDAPGAALYLGMTIVLSLGAVWLGHAVAAMVNR